MTGGIVEDERPDGSELKCREPRRLGIVIEPVEEAIEVDKLEFESVAGPVVVTFGILTILLKEGLTGLTT